MERASATRCCASSAREPRASTLSIPTPFMVGRVNCYLIEDDPLTLVDVGPNSRQGAGRARARARRPRPPRSRTSSGSSSPTSTSTTSAWSASSPGARMPRSCALDLLAPRDRELRRARGARRRARRGADAAPRDPARRGHRAALRVALVPRLGRLGRRSRRRCRRRRARVRRPHAAGAPPPGPLARPTRSSTTRAASTLIGGDHLIGHISSNPLISRPLGRQVGRARRRPPARADDLHALAARDARDAARARPARPRRAGHRPRAR